MGLVKICYSQNFLHQKFYQTSKTKYIIYSPRKHMYMPSKYNISYAVFTFSSHLGKYIESSAFLKLLSNICFRWYQKISNIKTCESVFSVEMNNNLPYVKKAMESSVPLI